MPIKGTVTVDSGLFLTDEAEVGYTYTEVGYFSPKIRVYDGSPSFKDIDLKSLDTGRNIQIRHTDKNGNDLGRGIKLTDCLVNHLFRLHKVYDPTTPPDDVNPDVFDYLFHFNSGVFRSSNVKERFFISYDPKTGSTIGKPKSVGEIANDLIATYSMEDTDQLRLIGKNGPFWTSTPGVPFDVQILADYSTKMQLYCDAVNLGSNPYYWIPNSDPPPGWSHNGQP